MKFYEMLADEIVVQKKIEALMKLKAQKLHELKEIDATLRKIIYRKRKWKRNLLAQSTIQRRFMTIKSLKKGEVTISTHKVRSFLSSCTI